MLLTRFFTKLQRSGGVYLMPMLALTIAVAARAAAPGLLRPSLWCFDLFQQAAPREAADLPIRIVDIDDASLRRVGQWPWPRSTVAELVDRLREAGAAIVAFDIVFAEPDRTSPKQLRRLFPAAERDKAEPLLAALPDPDKALADAVAKLPVVTGFALTDGDDDSSPARKPGSGFALAGNDPLNLVKPFLGAIVNRPGIEAPATGNGFFTLVPEWDGVVRRIPLVLRLRGQPLPSLDAEVLRLATGAGSYVVCGAGACGNKSFGENTGMTAMEIGPLRIPTDAAGRVWLHFARSSPSLYVSAADVLDGKADPARLKGDIVLIGSSATGVSISDLKATPLAHAVPGVEVHAQLIGQVLSGSYLVRPDWAKGAETLFTAFAGIGLILAVPALGALFSAVLGGAGVGAAAASSWFAFRYGQLLIDPVYPVAVLTIVYFAATLLGYLRTERGQREIRSAFSRYMSPVYVEQLARHPEKLVLGGEDRELTIMFSDIRGFTSLAEGLDARALTHLMNSFTSPMTDIIAANRGTIDKYIGDCIMAFWNAPLDDPEHAKNAVRSAQQMRRKLIELNRGWEAEARAAGRPFKPLRIGIGINTGQCVVGNFGSTQRFNYSLLGDPVNLASRLEGLSKLYGVDLVIGEETAMQLDDPGLIELDLVAVKGKKQAVRVFTVPPEGIDKEKFVDLIERQGALLTAYRRQDWAAALRLLDDRPREPAPELAPVYDLYRRRIAHFQMEPPPNDWDGVFTAEEK